MLTRPIPMDSRPYAGDMSLPIYGHLLLQGCLFLAINAGCSRDSTPASEKSAVTETKALRKGYEIPIPMIEYWEGTNILKFKYEMRYGVDGKVARNGWASAYYGNGNREREGAYIDNERAGTWTYYTIDGGVSRTEEREGNPVWTGPDQHKAAPGTEQ